MSGQRLWVRRRGIPLGVDEEGRPFGSVVIESASADEAETPLRTRILAALGDVGDVGATGPQLLLALGLSADKRGSLYKALRGLLADLEIIREGARGRERYSVKNADA